MALTTCPDCGREVSDAAPACPGCGRPMKAASVQMTEGATGEFLDPMANARGCLRMVALLFLCSLALFAFCVMSRR